MKIAKLFQMAQTLFQSCSSNHCVFGLNLLKFVCNRAFDLGKIQKQQFEDENMEEIKTKYKMDEQTIVNALIGVILPNLLKQDHSLFLNLVQDIFPGLEYENTIGSKEINDAIEKGIELLNVNTNSSHIFLNVNHQVIILFYLCLYL